MYDTSSHSSQIMSKMILCVSPFVRPSRCDKKRRQASHWPFHEAGWSFSGIVFFLHGQTIHVGPLSNLDLWV